MRANTLVRRADWSDLFDLMTPADMVRNLRGEIIRVEEFTEANEFVVRAELPGIDPDRDLNVTAADGFLTISATREESTAKTEDGIYRSEFRYGMMSRTVQLPTDVEIDKIEATYRQGVLEVRMPRTDRAGQHPKKVMVKSE
jgi:HSP20 family protein